MFNTKQNQPQSLQNLLQILVPAASVDAAIKACLEFDNGDFLIQSLNIYSQANEQTHWSCQYTSNSNGLAEQACHFIDGFRASAYFDSQQQEAALRVIDNSVLPSEATAVCYQHQLSSELKMLVLAIVNSQATPILNHAALENIKLICSYLAEGLLVETLEQKLKECDYYLALEKKTSELYKDIFNHVGDALFYHAPNGKILNVNQQAVISLGYSKKELLTMNVKDIDVQVSEKTTLLREIRDDYKPGEPVAINSWHRRKDGSVFPVEVTVTLHGPENMLATVKDISQREYVRKELEKSRKKYKALINNAFDAIVVFDRDANINYASHSAYRLLEYDESFRAILNITEYFADSCKEKINSIWREVLASPENPVDIEELELKKFNGVDTLWVKATITNFLHDPDINGVVINFSDLTKEKMAVAELQNRKRLYEALVERSFDGVALYDVTGNMIFASDSSKNMLGYTDYEVMPTNALDYVYEADRSIPIKAWQDIADKPGKSVELKEYRLVARDGRLLWVQNTLTNLLADPSVKAIVSNFRDITKNKENEKTLHKIANYDNFTGLPNRNLLLKHLKNLIEKSSINKLSFGLICFDIASLNAINNAHGRSIGDKVILKLVDILQKNIKEEDFVAKTGDDEFAIVATDLNTYHLSRLSQTIINEFSQLLSVGDTQVKPNLKAGVSLYPKDAILGDKLISNAEVAVKKAKADGELFAFYQNYDSEQTRYRLNLEKDLHEAINNNDLKLVYQPVFDIASGNIYYCEALLRWMHPIRGPIDPNLFVKLAEETSLITSLSQWVIHSAIKQVAELRDQGLSLSVAINLSPKDIGRKNTASYIIETLKSYNLQGDSIHIEITESEEVRDLDFSISQIKELNQFGVKVILDDFGTGFSSISHLLQLPISGAKVDKSFVNKIDNDNSSKAKNFLSAIISLVQENELITIVEGVETAEQLKVLQAKPGILVQGFLFAKPQPIKELKAMLKKGKLDFNQLIN
ncbi:GGDEF domain-containing phosphodiesterase [Kangiella sp. TOML190]|uniref:sensor domain-containing protein n=1 Tax=Kangiella sp. TOML190 TaxID=2931351 RepID=UPI00203D4362|nr:GGDEF domain-containing phosphodiesterase [Kangiella sp. TOML190]